MVAIATSKEKLLHTLIIIIIINFVHVHNCTCTCTSRSLPVLPKIDYTQFTDIQTHFDWCEHCRLGRRDISHYPIEDVMTLSIYLHAMWYMSCCSGWAWSFCAPPPKWLNKIEVEKIFYKMNVKDRDYANNNINNNNNNNF